MGEENLIGEAGSKSVSGFSGLGRGSRNRSVERRKQEDASVLERRAQSFRDTHLFDASCRAENYVLRAIEKDPQALLFHRCLETTDNRAVLGAQGVGEVIDLPNRRSGASAGAENGQFVGQFEDTFIADRKNGI